MSQTYSNYHKKYYEKNKLSILARQKARRGQYDKKYYDENKEAILAKRKQARLEKKKPVI